MYFLEHGILIGVGKRWLSDIHLVDYTTQSPQVGLVVADAVLEDFGGHVVGGAHEGRPPFAVLLDILLLAHLLNIDDLVVGLLAQKGHGSVCAAEVREFEVSVLGAEEVGCLL